MSSIKKVKDVWKSKAACGKAVEGSNAGDEQEEDNVVLAWVQDEGNNEMGGGEVITSCYAETLTALMAYQKRHFYTERIDRSMHCTVTLT